MRSYLPLPPNAQKNSEERAESLSDRVDNPARHTKFFKYPRIFHHVSTNISSRIRDYFIKYPRIFYFLRIPNRLFVQIDGNFTE